MTQALPFRFVEVEMFTNIELGLFSDSQRVIHLPVQYACFNP